MFAVRFGKIRLIDGTRCYVGQRVIATDLTQLAFLKILERNTTHGSGRK